MKLNVMTFNIHHGEGTDKVLDLERIARVIQHCDADVVGLNEVDRFAKRTGYVDQATELARMLKMNVSFGPALIKRSIRSKHERQYGNALLSRYPITHCENHIFHFPIGIENRALLEGILEFGSQNIHVFVTHLSLDPVTRRIQTNNILQITQKSKLPKVLMGDWNMHPNSGDYLLVTNRFIDAWTNSYNMGNTFPSHHPKKRLDYIFVDSAFEIIDSQVIHTTPNASDHLPLVSTLRLKINV